MHEGEFLVSFLHLQKVSTWLARGATRGLGRIQLPPSLVKLGISPSQVFLVPSTKVNCNVSV